MGQGGEVRQSLGKMNKSELKMKAARRRFLQIMTGAVASPAISRLAMAETYPARPVHLVVPVPPGGTFDIVGRLVAAALSERLGQQVVVDNRDGVATAIGTGFVAHAQPDGYTLLLAGSPAAINETLYSNLDFSFTRDIAPVASIERAPLIMVVNSSLPV
jgi:tripartite-type tricarboxylate transporter receptor subunit TctC